MCTFLCGFMSFSLTIHGYIYNISCHINITTKPKEMYLFKYLVKVFMYIYINVIFKSLNKDFVPLLSMGGGEVLQDAHWDLRP